MWKPFTKWKILTTLWELSPPSPGAQGLLTLWHHPAPSSSAHQRIVRENRAWSDPESASLTWLLFIYLFNWRLITLQYCSGFCCTLTWISHGCTCVPHPEPSSHLLPHPIPQGCPMAPALSALFHALNLDWSSISHMVIYMFQCYSLKSSDPRLLPQSPEVCSFYLCLFCCLTYRIVITMFLNSIYMH